jgi:hypothetical protein
MQEIKKPTHSERGRLGATALNSNPEKKQAAARKAAKTRLAKDPDVFKKMGAIRNKEK